MPTKMMPGELPFVDANDEYEVVERERLDHSVKL
jgi:hypothetical protein